MPNVKLGNDTLNGVNTVRLQKADGGGGYESFVANIPEIVQTTGDSETAVMSQKATTDEINSLKSDLANKLPKSPADWEQWTDAEQAAARERIGEPKYELIEKITLDGTEAQLIRDYTDNPYKKIMLKTSLPAVPVKMGFRYYLNNTYIIDSDNLGDSTYVYEYISRFELVNGLLMTLLNGNRGSNANRVNLQSSVLGESYFFNSINNIQLNITNPVESTQIYIYGVRA